MVMDLTKKILEQLIKEELKKIRKPPQKAEAWLDVVGSVFFGDVDGEGADPCLKDPAAKQLIKTQMMELKNLNPEELDYIANKSADLIESFESELIGDADELLAASGEGTGAGYEYDQQILKMAEKYECMVKIFKTIFDKASEISAAKSQVRSDKQKALGKRGGGEIIVYDKRGKPSRRLGVGRDRKMFQITRESNTKLTKSKLEQLIKEAIQDVAKASERARDYGGMQYQYLNALDQYARENKGSKEAERVFNDVRYLMNKETNPNSKEEKNKWLEKNINNLPDPEKQPKRYNILVALANHPAFKGVRATGSTHTVYTVKDRGGPSRPPPTDAEIEARYKRMLDKLKKR